nr:single-stranded DNA-binding protein 4 isoform X1 [Pogona vitticeps]
MGVVIQPNLDNHRSLEKPYCFLGKEDVEPDPPPRVGVKTKGKATQTALREKGWVNLQTRRVLLSPQSSAATSSPVMASLAPGDGLPPGPLPSGVFQGPPSSQPSQHAQAPLANPGAMMMGPHNQPFMGSRFPGGLRPSLRMPSQPPVGVPGSQPFLPVVMDSAARAHASVGPGPCMTPPRGMTGVVPQSYGGGMRVPPGSLAGMPTLSMGPGIRGPWLNMNPNAGPFSSPSPGSYGGPTGGSGPPGTPLMPSPGDSTNSSENMYVMNSTGPPGSRPSFSMGASPEGPVAMEPHHLNGSLGPAEMDSLPKVRG